MIGELVTDAYIRAWKHAYFGHARDWPSKSIIAKIVEWGIRLDPSRTHTTTISDGDLVAMIVAEMRQESLKVHDAFIAYHLSVVDGVRHPKARHYQLAKMLGISHRTLGRRTNTGKRMIRARLTEVLDSRAIFYV